MIRINEIALSLDEDESQLKKKAAKILKINEKYIKKLDKKEKRMKQWSEIIRNVTMLSQLGLSLITPVLICLAVCWLIVSKTGAGGWVYIPGFFFGLGGSGTVAYKFYLSINRQQKKENKKKKNKVSFNRHL